MSEWKTIDSAPRDIELLVLRRDGVIHVAKVGGYENRYGLLSCDFGNASCSFFFPIDNDYESYDAPTHWMPLPNLPEE